MRGEPNASNPVVSSPPTVATRHCIGAIPSRLPVLVVAHGDFSPSWDLGLSIAKAADPVCGSAASRGFSPGLLGRFPIWRRTRCAFANGVNAGHLVVVIDVPELRQEGGLRDREGQRGLTRDTRNLPLDDARRSATANRAAATSAAADTGHTCPQERRT